MVSDKKQVSAIENILREALDGVVREFQNEKSQIGIKFQCIQLGNTKGRKLIIVIRLGRQERNNEEPCLP